MATLLYRLGKTAYRRWPLFLAGWLAVIIALGGFAATFSKPMSDVFSIPGIPSEKAADLQAELFPGTVDAFNQATVKVVVVAPEGTTLSDPQFRRAVDTLVADLAQVPQTADDVVVANPVDAAAGLRAQLQQAATANGTPQARADADIAALLPLTSDGRAGLISWDLDVDSPAEVEPETREAIIEAMETARESGLTVEANGTGMQVQAKPNAASEALGVGVALIVLVLTFGSLVAAGLPVLTALLGVGLGVSGITAMTAFTEIGSSTPALATMIGLAVGIDYALFILARYQSERYETDDREEAVGRAVGTSGSAVVFAGLTVMIALGALAVVGIPFLTAMGVAAAATVAVAVLIALTLLPALLGVLKSKAFGARVLRFKPHRDADGNLTNRGVTWARALGRHPVAAIVVTVVALGALAVPLKDIYLAFPTDSTAPSDTTQRKASDAISEAFGPGREAPMLVVVDGREVAPEQRPAAYGEVVAWVAGQDGVRNAQVVMMNEEGTGAQVLVTPEFGPDDERTLDLLMALRDGQSDLEERTGTSVGVTGLTAITTDVSDQLTGALPRYLTVVVGLAFLLLVVVFRSILVPLTATLGFVLSVLATLGATVAVFQKGALGLVEGQPIVSFVPIFLVGVVFGLAMDYQVFLVTRMREAYVHGATAHEAIVEGFHSGARVVSAAALIMISVFAAFVLQDDPVLKSIGFALAAAVLLDAFVVRMVLIPALMYLLGDRAWWMPRWLDRLVPNVDVEGEKLLHRQQGAAQVGDGDAAPDLVGAGR